MEANLDPAYHRCVGGGGLALFRSPKAFQIKQHGWGKIGPNSNPFESPLCKLLSICEPRSDFPGSIDGLS